MSQLGQIDLFYGVKRFSESKDSKVSFLIYDGGRFVPLYRAHKRSVFSV